MLNNYCYEKYEILDLPISFVSYSLISYMLNYD